MFKNRAGRSGFTLPEVLVTVAIVAILAAAVVPAVTQQISKGDQGQFQGTVQGMNTAITTFVADVRKFPAALSQLTNAIGTGDSVLVPAGDFTAGDANRWQGPYLQTEIAGPVSNVGSLIPIGFGLTVRDTLSFGANNFLIAIIEGDSAAVVRADALADNADGASDGVIRWASSGGPPAAFDSAWVQLITAR